MFLTQEHSIAEISADSDLTVEIGSQESVWQNVAVFQEIENVLEDSPARSSQAAFSTNELCQKLVASIFCHLPRR